MKKNRQAKFSPLVKAERTKETVHDDIFPDKVPLEKLRAIWNDEQVQYSDEQLYKIREWLYALTRVIIHVKEKQANNDKIIELKPNANETAESNIICPGEYRRAS
jgi:hypothetical protein